MYTNKEYQTFNGYAPAKNSTIDILPNISARVQNVAVWKYVLPEEQISRLFTYGLFYIANDDKQLKIYRKRVNTITFAKNQQEFVNDLLVPFNESFTEEIWQRKKKQADDDESKYFHSHTDYSTIDFYGNQTYLVLNKSDQAWSQYTLILDLLIPHWPKTDELVTLISWDSKIEISITHNGKLSLDNHESSSTITPNEYFRLYISVHDGLLQIYLNEKLEIDLSAKDDQYQYQIKSNRIDLFKETNPTKNTTDENTLRVSFKSITSLDRSVSLDQLQSPRLIALPLEKIAPNLVAMGYQKNWIKSVMEQNQTVDIPTVLREQKEQFIQSDLDNERERYRKIFSRLNPSIKSEVLEELLPSSKLNTPEQINTLAQSLFVHLIAPPSSTSSLSKSPLKTDWFSQTVQHFDIPSNHYRMDCERKPPKPMTKIASINYLI